MAEAVVTFTPLTDAVGDDPQLLSLVAPFRARLETRIGEVIGEASGILVKSWPEGSLGNFAADAVLHAARARMDESVEMALVNNGGLRIPIPEGPITVGRIFELMPFENMVTVLSLEGSQVEALAQEIARRGGEPVAGLSFHIDTGGEDMTATNLRVGGEEVEPDRLYRLATSDYLANGGDEMTTLTRPMERLDLDLLIRDALIQYVREKGIIHPILEGRVTGDVRR
jgi:2',3'-cyclic-nucleotide 2'-phosphodiesterase (5'-nucleotidase family)